ncbi:cystinosin homolog isoform X3 [Andrographis paniculata]|uniref:cystinosin homolog isoform X3 n=1 Tax=Andrographis paniculata TaxID=175694 RepID=UPI0021E938E0|nr:cystinosin homolog isoform X3 [Andrographis paniculata]
MFVEGPHSGGGGGSNLYSKGYSIEVEVQVMASWNSVQLEVLYHVLGWIAFVSWSISFYPQVVLNFRRKSVVGLNFDFVLLNLTKHSSYLIYNASLFFSSTVQRQYREKFGFNEMIPVAANDVAFSTHAVLLTAFTLFQIAIYERGNQKVSRIAIGIVSVAWLSAAVCVFVAIPRHSWFWLVAIFNNIQVVMTVIKYIPQAISNFRRKSTVGFSIGNILLDFLGGVTNYCQMAVQSIDQHSWVNFYGNIGKTMISLVSIFFDILFIIQHYILYPSKKVAVAQPLVEPSSDIPQSETEVKECAIDLMHYRGMHTT